MTHRQETPNTATSRPQGPEQAVGDSRDADTHDKPSDARTARHRAAIADVMLLGLESADLTGDDGIRRIHDWADWLAEQAAHITDMETQHLRAERDLLARTLAIHTQQTVDTVLADTRNALADRSI